MKNLSTILLLFFVPTILIGQNLKALDDKYGFRGAKFEIPFSSFKDLVEIGKSSGFYFYKSTTEDLKLGDYSLDKVTYTFYKGQLFGINLYTKGFSNSARFLSILQEAYGPGYQENEYIERYVWLGAKVRMSYEKNSITDDADIVMVSSKLLLLQEADEKRANSEAAKKL